MRGASGNRRPYRDHIIVFQVGKIPQNVRLAGSLGQHFQNINNAYPHPANARVPMALIGLNCDAGEQFLTHGDRISN